MADDWKPGDLALCVHPEAQLVAGAVYTVDFAFWDAGSDTTSPGWGLALIECPWADFGGEVFDGFDAWRFIKPANEADELDRETIALLTGKPAQVSA